MRQRQLIRRDLWKVSPDFWKENRMERIAHILLLILIVAIPYLLFIYFLVIPSCKFMANRDEEARRISKEFQKSKIQSDLEKGNIKWIGYLGKQL